MSNQQPPTECEVKFAEVNLSAMRAKLKNANAKLVHPERLMRRVIFGSEANHNMKCTYGRIRDESGIVTMSAKFSAVNNEITSQKEAMVVVDDFEQANIILRSFGLVVTNYQENRRETWKLPDGTIVELETWPGLPTYLEIEGGSVDSLRQASEILGLAWDQHITDSTDKIYAKHFEISNHEALKKLKDIRFS